MNLYLTILHILSEFVALNLTERELVRMKRARRSESRKMKRGRHNQNESGEDRLSDLPDSIVLHIMSFMMIKDAVQTCILSKRWKGLWKCIPSLTLHTSDFRKHSIFSEFVSGIVSCRDGNHPLLSLDFSRHGYFQPQILTNLMRYAVSHNVQQLRIYVPYNLGLPSYVFSCQSLSSLDISVSSYDVKRRTKIPKSIELPALVSLHLENVAFSTDDNGHAEPFSTCRKLNTLSIDHLVLLLREADIDKSGTLIISNAKLANLTIDEYSSYKIVVSTPNLSSFTVNGSPFSPFQKLRGQEGINIEFNRPHLYKINHSPQISSGTFFLSLLNEIFFGLKVYEYYFGNS